MSLPLWDPIEVPPDTTLVDVNAIEDDDLRLQLQGEALDLWIEEQGLSYEDQIVREWSEDEGVFAVYEDGEIVGLTFIVGVEDA